MLRKQIACLAMAVSVHGFSQSATTDASVSDSTFVASDSTGNLKFNYKQLVVPSILIGYGIVGIESDQLKSFNTQIRQEVTEDIDRKITIDDFTQWAPSASVFALHAMGVEGQHNLRDRSTIFLTSFAIMSTTVFGLKSITKIERPDGSSRNSFPSGHTATAFMGAEFLWQEYKDKSVWYGIAGYAVATGTGLFRMYNNRHWLTDVAAGAGIGILSMKAAYWLNPRITRTLFGEKSAETRNPTSFVVPMYDGRNIGLGFVKTF